MTVNTFSLRFQIEKITKIEQNTLSNEIIISYTFGISKSDENFTKTLLSIYIDFDLSIFFFFLCDVNGPIIFLATDF